MIDGSKLKKKDYLKYLFKSRDKFKLIIVYTNKTKINIIFHCFLKKNIYHNSFVCNRTTFLTNQLLAIKLKKQIAEEQIKF